MSAPGTPMPAADKRLLVHAYVDGELAAAEALALKLEIDSDARLAAEAENAAMLSQVLSRKFPAAAVPDNLRKRIDAEIGVRSKVARPTWMALAAAIVLSAGLSSWLTWSAVPTGSHIVDDLVDRHMQRLLASNTVDIPSSDRHTVKPWFNSHVPSAPQVADLSSDGFPLVGGRIDVVNSKIVPTLVYGRRLHTISLTEIPKDLVSHTRGAPRTVNGFNSVTWTEGDLIYWAISDLNEKELAAFAKLFRAGIGGKPE